MTTPVRIEPARVRVVSARKFLRLLQSQKNDILSARVTAPRLGSRGFGKIEVVLRESRQSLDRLRHIRADLDRHGR